MLLQEVEHIPKASKLHARIGHPLLSNWNRYAKITSSPALKLDHVTLCSTCSVSKEVIHKGITSTTNYTILLQLISVDICDPIRYEDFNSNKHFMTLRDTYSRYYADIYLRTKSEAVIKLINWIQKMEKLFFFRRRV